MRVNWMQLNLSIITYFLLMVSSALDSPLSPELTKIVSDLPSVEPTFYEASSRYKPRNKIRRNNMASV